MKVLKFNESFGFPPVPARMIMMSHLSDIQEITDRKEIDQRCNFVKFLLMKYSDTSVNINADEEFAEFLTKFPQFKM